MSPREIVLLLALAFWCGVALGWLMRGPVGGHSRACINSRQEGYTLGCPACNDRRRDYAARPSAVR